MNYTNDTSFLMMILVMPSLFGLALLGEGVSKVMNYDPKGWIGIVAGSLFVVLVVVAWVMVGGGQS